MASKSKQQTITRYFTKEVKIELRRIDNVKEEINIEWDEKDNFYASPVATVSRKPSNSKTGMKIAVQKTKKTTVLKKPPNSKIGKKIADKTKKTQECPKCKKSFVSIPSFKWHVHYCGKERRLQCAHCSYKTKYKKCLIRHISRLHPGETGDARPNNKPELQKYCQKCEKSYEVSNMKSCETCFSKLIFRCPVCNQNFNNLQVARYHWRTRCGMKGYYHCHSCDYKAAFRSGVIEHSKKAHQDLQSSETILWKKLVSEVEKQSLFSYKCTKCLKPFDNAFGFKTHVRQCREAEKGEKLIANDNLTDPNRCSICRKKFQHVYSLNRHIISCMKYQHIAKRTNDSEDEIVEVVEDHPPVALISADEINKGMKGKAIKYCEKCMIESEIEEKWRKNSFKRKFRCHNCKTFLVIKCKKCLKKFSTERCILPHLKYVCYPEEEFKCTKCNFKAVSAIRIGAHYKAVHITINSKCKKCGKKFKNPLYLKTHMQRCGVEPKFQCEHCPYKSKLKREMRSHIFRSHMEPVVIDRSESLKISAQRFYRTLIHLVAHCTKCKEKQLLKKRRKNCEKCKTKLNFKCKTCKKNYFVDDENACDHVKAYLETIKFECNRCGVGSISKTGLTMHRVRCGASHPCRFCKYVSSVRGTTRKHEKSKHPDKV